MMFILQLIITTVLILHGEDDKLVPLKESKRVCAELSPSSSIDNSVNNNNNDQNDHTHTSNNNSGAAVHVSLIPIQKCGHVLHEEFPDMFVQLAGSFISKLRFHADSLVVIDQRVSIELKQTS